MGVPKTASSGVILEESEWLSRLAEPKTRVRIEFKSTPARMTTTAAWDTGERRLPEHLLYFVAESRCSATLDGRKMIATAGSLSWVAPETPYHFQARSGEKPPVIYRFRFTVGDEKNSRLKWNFRFVPNAWILLEWMRQIAWEAERPGEFSSERIKNLLALLSIEVFSSSRTQAKAGTTLSAAQRTQIAQATDETISKHLRPAELARKLRLSPDYFSRIFRRTYGEAPRTWFLKQKLARAAALLRESSEPIAEIARQLGYNETYLFSRQFHHQFDMSPRKWRQAETIRDKSPE